MSRNPSPSRATLQRIQRDLLAWWDAEKRDLPWRRTRDPYAIWVSEIMLQQTRVETVKPYYHRWLAELPTVTDLASADEGRVLKLWEGLGYYSRARSLHQAARTLVRDHDGRLPRSVDALRRLPGIGPYTAGAIASIAFDLDEPVLDGNVIRVVSRLFEVDGDVKSAEIRESLWELAGKLVPPGQAGRMNQALMDLGAMVCLPRKALCEVCPVAEPCRARAAGRVGELPVKSPPKAVPHFDIAAGVVCKGGRVLIDQRPADGLLGGLWEFPGGKIAEGESAVEAVRREIREEVGIEVAVGDRLVTVRHAYSHFRITMQVFACEHTSGRARPIACQKVRWVWPSQLKRYAFPKANHAVLELLSARPGQ